MFAERLPASQRLLSELAEHVHDACVCCVLVFLDRRDMSDERTTYPLSSISAASDIGRVNGYAIALAAVIYTRRSGVKSDRAARRAFFRAGGSHGIVHRRWRQERSPLK